MGKTKYTKEHHTFIKRYAKGISNQELCDKFNKRFDSDITAKKIKYLKNRLDIQSGYHGGAWNKGIKRGVVTSGAYKKRNANYLWRPTGSEYVRNGYTVVKVYDIVGCPAHIAWKRKHVLIYENYWKIKLSKNEKLIFLDGDKMNLDIDNLYCVTHSEMLYLNKNKLLTNNRDVTLSNILLAKINCVKRGREQ